MIYFLGATVLAGRLMMYHLPWEIVISQLPQSFLVAIGVTEVVAPLIIIGLIYSLVLLADWQVKPLRIIQRLLPRAWSPGFERIRLQIERRAAPFREIIGWTLTGLLLFLIARVAFRAATGWSPPQALVAALAAVVGAAATYLVLRNSVGLTWWSERRRARSWLRAGAVAAAFLPLIAWNAITLPMPYAQVCPTKSLPKAGGWLIGQTNDRLILGNPDPIIARRSISLTPSSDATIMATYQDPALVPLPPCPAIPSGS